MWRVDSLEKTLMLGGIGGRRRRRRQRMRWLDGISDLMDASLSELRSWWWTGRPGVQQFMGLQRIGHDWVNWTISFRIMHFEIYLCYHVCQSFLFTVEWYSVIYQFFHPFTNWWLRSCFQLLPNRNRAITSICIQDFMQTKVFISLGFLPKSRIAKSLIIYWFKGWGTILLIC